VVFLAPRSGWKWTRLWTTISKILRRHSITTCSHLVRISSCMLATLAAAYVLRAAPAQTPCSALLPDFWLLLENKNKGILGSVARCTALLLNQEAYCGDPLEFLKYARVCCSRCFGVVVSSVSELSFTWHSCASLEEPCHWW